MKCLKCSQKAVFNDPSYCKKHFIDYFEAKVKKIIKDYKLLNKYDKVCVAASGGKDSTTVLYLLKKLGYNVEALAIDEGIKGYRDKTLEDLKKFCKKNKIKLRIYSFKQNYKKTLDQMLKKERYPCTICGTKRRILLNKYSKNYDVLATGHNADDEAQSILMNLLKAQTSLIPRLSPKSKKQEGYTPRIKPLYFLTEKKIMAYTILKNLGVHFTQCPHRHDSFRLSVRDALNEYEEKNKGTKKAIIKNYLKKI
jgi:tRNA(Ile)-lysidine synthase TilS/MesJ